MEIHPIKEFMHNMYFWAALASWFLAQSIKVAYNCYKQKRFDFSWFLETGGMPSSHTSAVTTMTAMFGAHFGFASPIFALSVLLAIITMSDAAGVRRAAGKQARVLNQILDDVSHHKKVKAKKLRELLGHTPVEVFAGIALGIFVAILFLP